MRILDCWGYGINQGNVRRAILHQAGDNLAALERDKSISGNMGGVGAQGVFEESGVVAAYPKDKEVSGVADDSVLEFVVVNLCKELVGEGEVELVLACFG